MKKYLAIGAAVMLSACVSEQQSCIGDAMRQVNSLQSKVNTAQQNISRGYAVHTQRVPYTYSGTCYDSAYNPYSCPETGYRNEETPVAIDVAQERIKLASLQRQLTTARAASNAAVAQCRSLYPE